MSTRAIRQAEVGAAKTMIDRTEACFGLKPQRLSGDSAYGAAEILGWIVEERNIAPHVALWDKSERTDGTFSRSDFVFDAMANAYTCPGGKLLRKYRWPFTKPRVGVTKDKTLIYNASQHDCAVCALKRGSPTRTATTTSQRQGSPPPMQSRPIPVRSRMPACMQPR